MKRVLSSILLGILFSIVFFITTFSLTAMNYHFVYKIMDKNDYYSYVYKNIIVDIKKYDDKLDIKLKKENLKKDIMQYVKGRYNNKTIISKVNIKDKKIEDIYNKNIKVKMFEDKEIWIYMYGIYLITIILICIIGILLKKTKMIHNIFIVFVTNFVLSIIIYGILYFIRINDYFLDMIFNSFKHYYLAYSIIVFEMSIFIKYKYLFDKKRD